MQDRSEASVVGPWRGSGLVVLHIGHRVLNRCNMQEERAMKQVEKICEAASITLFLGRFVAGTGWQGASIIARMARMRI